jgi:hypothetical protein
VDVDSDLETDRFSSDSDIHYDSGHADPSLAPLCSTVRLSCSMDIDTDIGHEDPCEDLDFLIMGEGEPDVEGELLAFGDDSS